MQLDDLKDQLKERILTLWNSVQEQPAYHSFLEKWYSLSATAQKIAKAGAIIGGVFLIFIIFPLPFLKSSWVQTENFEDNRSLIRELFKSSLKQNINTSIINGPKNPSLERQIKSMLNEFNLLPEQIVKVSSFSPAQVQLIKSIKTKNQSGLTLSLKNLNLNQIVDIGYKIQSISPGIKIVGLEITASTEKDMSHYFDTEYRMRSYQLNEIKEFKIEKKSKGRSKAKKRGKRS